MTTSLYVGTLAFLCTYSTTQYIMYYTDGIVCSVVVSVPPYFGMRRAGISKIKF